MNINKRLERWFKLRFAILYPFGVFLVLFAIPDDKSIQQGIGFIITGLLIRSWANGYAIKMDKLTTSGPYAFIRHPLYLGTALVIAGFIIMLKFYYLGALFLIILLFTYSATIKKEENMLEAKFGAPYLDYKKNVPMIFPALRPYRKGEKWPFSFKRLIKSQEYKAFFWMIILVIVFHLKEEFISEKEKPDAKIIGLIIAAFILGISDLIGEFIKKKIKSDKNKLL
ncbi:MAG: isoprenylcysteine carboxylmethyltransferase family protein [Candidatus Omnitrophica bacterium]|nr:isoprenylcysteine carboxylmethyltransferase family protein [Candidatus Omnitrophota bacterium]